MILTPERIRPERIFLSVPHTGGAELRSVEEAFRTNWVSTAGPHLRKLEEEIGRRIGHPAVALISGTAAIHCGLRLLGVGAGDEVIVPSLTFVASCNPICYQGGTPVFMDSERESWNLDPQLLSDLLKRRSRLNRVPKALVVVHLFGQSAEMQPICEICERYEVPILEDAAEALGACYRSRPVGSFGDVGVFSLNGNKVITSGGGGLLVSPHADWVERARFWSAQACDPDELRDYVHSELGYNYRLSNILAGVAVGQLPLLDERIAQRRAVFHRYQSAFASIPGIEPQGEAPPVIEKRSEGGEKASAIPNQGCAERIAAASAGADRPELGARHRHTRWLSCFLIEEAKFGLSASDLIRFLDAANIEARPVWKPMHTQPLYRGYECLGGAVAEDLNRRGICLPSSSSLSPEEQQFVIERVREAHRRSCR